MDIKIYTTDKVILDKVCTDFNLTPDYTYSSVGGKIKIEGKGYCSSEGHLRVFSQGSHVDENYEEKDITSDYVKTKFIL